MSFFLKAEVKIKNELNAEESFFTLNISFTLNSQTFIKFFNEIMFIMI